MTQQLVTQSEFAGMIKRSGARVSQLIKEGKLRPPAVVGKKIDPVLARAMLEGELDQTQQMGLPEHKRIMAADAPALDEPEERTGAPSANSLANSRYIESKAQEKELDVEAKRRRMNAESGRWMETAAAARDFARDLSSIFTDLESWVMTCGQDLADALGVDHRTATLTVRKSLHAFRAAQAQKRRAEADAMPEFTGEPELQAAE